jgi:transcriptional regulator with XRE-family HTH domain
MDINEKIYRNVKAICKMNGLGLSDIERQIGRNPGYLSRKSTKVDVETLVKLAELLEYTTDDLMYGDYERELEISEDLKSLENAVRKVKQYFNKQGIMNFINPLFVDEDQTKEEDNEGAEGQD